MYFQTLKGEECRLQPQISKEVMCGELRQNCDNVYLSDGLGLYALLSFHYVGLPES